MLHVIYAHPNNVFSFYVPYDIQEPIYGEYPPRRAGHSIVCDEENSMMYVFGGRTSFTTGGAGGLGGVGVVGGAGLNDVWRYDTRKKRWTSLTTSTYSTPSTKSQHATPTGAPPGRQHSSMLMLNGNLYIFGGVDPSNGRTYNDVWTFVISERKWTVLYRPKAGDADRWV
jgi:N-acetylneuraminic acid mutarotase